VRFVSDLLDQLEWQYCIDRRRVFATGFSNGGMLVYTLGQELPHRFAALVREIFC
jgi:polyhydroxybutyrate depolymerase